MRLRSLFVGIGLCGLAVSLAQAAPQKSVAPPKPSILHGALRPVIRRLTRSEFHNAVRDLLGVSFDAVEALPPDAIEGGFDDMGDSLSMSPLLLERYVAIARQVATQASNSTAFLPCKPAHAAQEETCARRMLTPLVRRAFRRDVGAQEIAPFLAAYKKGRAQGDFQNGILLALESLLLSPDFLLRIEHNAGARPTAAQFELATRLSFLIWSSIPDDRLLDLAHAGKLTTRTVLEAEVRRMLANPRADALADNFGMQYLGLNDLAQFKPDPTAYPDFTPARREEFAQETRLFLRDIFSGNKSVLDLVGADYSFLNADLARQYGIAEVEGDQFRKVALDKSMRGGVLGQGSVLLVTSHEDVTSPVLRGKWVLANLLNQPVPPPPPGIPPLKPTDTSGHPLTTREQLAQHTAAPQCAACHVGMDPFGVSLENFDVVGRWRGKDETGPVDATAHLPDGAAWTGINGLKRYLLSQPGPLARAFAARLLTYALGRRLQGAQDDDAVSRIAAAAKAGGYRFDDLLLNVIESEPFLAPLKSS